MKRWIKSIAYPSFECEDCIGMRDVGCICAHYKAYGPGLGRGKAWQRLARWAHGLLWPEEKI